MLHLPLGSRSLGPLLALPLTFVLGGCASTTTAGEPEPYEFVEPPPKDPTGIGFFLTDFDSKLRAWLRLRLTGRGDTDFSQLRALQIDMRRTSKERMEELIEELEFGVPRNRSVAAAALGFSESEKAKAPLLAVLADDDDDVVSNALLGLGLLGFDDTPVGQITYLLRRHESSAVRSNAAFALHCLALAGLRDDEITRSCKDGLVDPEAGVRAQSAAVLGIVADVYAIDALAPLLGDDTPLVVSSAAAALGRIGRDHLEEKGNVARLMVAALERAKKAERAPLIHELTRLRDADLGDETEPWKEWAFRLP